MLTLRVRVDLGVMAMKGYSAFVKAPALLKPHHQMQFRVISEHSLVRVLSLKQRYSRCILQPQLVMKEYSKFLQTSRLKHYHKMVLVSYLGYLLGLGGVLPLCRDTVSIFYSPSWVGSKQVFYIIRLRSPWTDQEQNVFKNKKFWKN